MKRKPIRKGRSGMSVKAVIFCGEQLLILQKEDLEGRHPWEFPGGGLEFGEDFAVALRREVREETGLSVDILGPIGLWEYRRTSSYYLTGIIMACTTVSREVRLSKEHSAYAWVSPRELAEYPLHDSLKRALERISTDKLAAALTLSRRLLGEEK